MTCAEGHLRMNCHLCPDDGPCLRDPAPAAAPLAEAVHAAAPAAARWSTRAVVAAGSAGAVLATVVERLVS
jgi:hypothetical protein